MLMLLVWLLCSGRGGGGGGGVRPLQLVKSFGRGGGGGGGAVDDEDKEEEEGEEDEEFKVTFTFSPPAGYVDVDELVIDDNTSVSSSGKRSEKSKSLIMSNGILELPVAHASAVVVQVLVTLLHKPVVSLVNFFITELLFTFTLTFVPGLLLLLTAAALRILSRIAFTPIDEHLMSFS